jgi:hypothetical protein
MTTFLRAIILTHRLRSEATIVRREIRPTIILSIIMIIKIFDFPIEIR